MIGRILWIKEIGTFFRGVMTRCLTWSSDSFQCVDFLCWREVTQRLFRDWTRTQDFDSILIYTHDSRFDSERGLTCIEYQRYSASQLLKNMFGLRWAHPSEPVCARRG